MKKIVISLLSIASLSAAIPADEHVIIQAKDNPHLIIEMLDKIQKNKDSVITYRYLHRDDKHISVDEALTHIKQYLHNYKSDIEDSQIGWLLSMEYYKDKTSLLIMRYKKTKEGILRVKRYARLTI